MGNSDYLSEEEQFKEILNNEEISKIKDPELRNMRFKYWNLLHKTFLDEQRIPDSMLGKEFDKIKAAEKKSLMNIDNEIKWVEKDSYIEY